MAITEREHKLIAVIAANPQPHVSSVEGRWPSCSILLWLCTQMLLSICCTRDGHIRRKSCSLKHENPEVYCLPFSIPKKFYAIYHLVQNSANYHFSPNFEKWLNTSKVSGLTESYYCLLMVWPLSLYQGFTPWRETSMYLIPWLALIPWRDRMSMDL